MDYYHNDFLFSDSKKFPIQKSKDLDFQRMCYYYPRGNQFITFKVITHLNGEVLWYNDFCPSSSASYGDAALTGM